MKKEEMIAAINERFNGLTEEGVGKFFGFIMAWDVQERYLETTTPERLAELKAIEEKEQAEEKAQEEAILREREEYDALPKDSELVKFDKEQLLEVIEALTPSQNLFLLTLAKRLFAKV